MEAWWWRPLEEGGEGLGRAKSEFYLLEELQTYAMELHILYPGEPESLACTVAASRYVAVKPRKG